MISEHLENRAPSMCNQQDGYFTFSCPLGVSYRDTRQAQTLAAGESLKEVLRLQVHSVYGWSMVCLSWASLVLIQLQYLYLYVFTEMTIFSLKIQTFAVSHNCLTFLLGAFNNSPLTPRQQRTKQTQPWSKPKSWPSTRPGDITTKSSWVYNVQ